MMSREPPTDRDNATFIQPAGMALGTFAVEEGDSVMSVEDAQNQNDRTRKLGGSGGAKWLAGHVTAPRQ
jgi:hypothetical protein